MLPGDDVSESLADAILEGHSIDWEAPDWSPERVRPLFLSQLKVVAAVAALARSGHPPAALGSWGHLQLVEWIGRGAFGEVFRAWDTRLDREVALKLLPVDRSVNDRPASTFIHEGRLLARVRHPNVVTIYGAEQMSDRIGLCMEFVHGRTLEQILDDRQIISPADAIDIGLELCRAVSAVHGAGLLHRDIKTHNVMRAEDGRIVLMDFGAGRELESGVSPDPAGTPLYLAPEVLNGQPATIHSDIYSLGVLLYHLVTGSYPVHGRTVRDICLAHERGERTAVRAAHRGVPVKLARIIERAIDRRPERRYESADALSVDLAEIASAARTGRLSARARWLWGGAAASVLLATLLFASRNAPITSSIASVVGLPSRATLPPGEHPVIAVQPFRNLGSDPDGELIVDGLTYEIVGSLAVLEGLDVRGATSSLAWKDKTADVQEFGRELGANLVLGGSVLGLSSRLRINAQLVRVADNVTVWADSFEPADNDVLTVQKDISQAIINKLRLRGLGRRRYQLDPALSNVFLAARAQQTRHHVDNATRAARLFEQIITADPSFAPAHAGLASALGQFARATQTAEMPPPDPRMELAAQKAIELDPLLAEAHAAMGTLQARDHRWDNARASFTKAFELDPTLTTAHTEFVLMMLMPLGRIDEALRVLEEARSADPESLSVREVMAWVQVTGGRYDQAIESSRWVLERDPAFPKVTNALVRALILSGRTDEAMPLIKDMWELRGYVYARAGRRVEAEALADAHPKAPARQMLVYAGLGDKERAIEALERTAAVHWWRAATHMRYPEVAFLRDDPRVAALRQRMNLPE